MIHPRIRATTLAALLFLPTLPSLSLASLHQSSQPRSVTGLQCLPATVQTPCGSSPWCTHIHFRRSSFHAHAFLPVITQCRPADINRGKRAAAPVSNSRAPFSSSRNHQVKGKKEASNSPLYSPVSLPPFPSGRRIDVRPKLETKVVTLTLHLRRFRLACSGVSRNRLAASRDRTCATSQGGN